MTNELSTLIIIVACNLIIAYVGFKLGYRMGFLDGFKNRFDY
jgi:hypothetical protein